MSLLDNAPFAADDPQARELLAALLTAYDQGPEVRAFVLAAGMRAAEFAWTGPMAEVWPQVLRRAADQGRLRRLVGVIAEDPNSAAYGIIARLPPPRRSPHPWPPRPSPMGLATYADSSWTRSTTTNSAHSASIISRRCTASSPTA